MRLYLVRHPQPSIAPDCCYGRTDLAVPPLETARVAARLTAALPPALPIFSSPLQRCADLARTLADAIGSVVPACDARLMEMDFGVWEMCRWEAIPRAEIDAWAADLARYRPGGGESVLQMAQRVSAFYGDLLQQRPSSAIVVCHAGTMRLLMARQRGGLSPLEMALSAAK